MPAPMPRSRVRPQSERNASPTARAPSPRSQRETTLKTTRNGVALNGRSPANPAARIAVATRSSGRRNLCARRASRKPPGVAPRPDGSMEPSGLGATPGGFRDALRAQRFLLPELLVATAILAAGFAGLLPFSATPFLVVFSVVSLWLRGEGARAVGLALRSDWGRTLLLGIGAGIGYQGVSGMIAAGLGGFVFGLLYLATGRNLWASVIAHGTMDTVGFLLLFLGKYPGV